MTTLLPIRRIRVPIKLHRCHDRWLKITPAVWKYRRRSTTRGIDCSSVKSAAANATSSNASAASACIRHRVRRRPRISRRVQGRGRRDPLRAAVGPGVIRTACARAAAATPPCSRESRVRRPAESRLYANDPPDRVTRPTVDCATGRGHFPRGNRRGSARRGRPMREIGHASGGRPALSPRRDLPSGTHARKLRIWKSTA